MTEAVWPLVGRDAEVEVLARAVDGRRGVVLAGRPGVGKTRLLREADRVARDRGAHVERVVASRAAASMQLGAFAHLLPATVEPGWEANPIGSLQRELLRRADGAAVVLLVDDADTLDAGSAALVHQLAATGEATVVATVRTRAAVARRRRRALEGRALRPRGGPAAVAGRGRGPARRVLGGPVDATTAHECWEASRGNAMFLRELVRGGRERGTLAVRQGLWAWVGERRASPQLVELVAERLGELDEAEHDALAVLALGEPLTWDLFTRFVAPGVAEALVAKGLVETEERDGRLRARSGHPLFAEVLGDALPDPTRRRMLRALADELFARADADADDLLRAVTWRVNSGDEVAADHLIAAVRHCLHIDMALSERLARLAYGHGGGFGAVDVLAQINQFTRRPDDTETLLASLDPGELSAEERLRLVVLRANNLMWDFSPDDAVALIDDAIRRYRGRRRPPGARGARTTDPGVRGAGPRGRRPRRGPPRRARRVAGTAHARVPRAALRARHDGPARDCAHPRCRSARACAAVHGRAPRSRSRQIAATMTIQQQWVGQLDAAEAIMRPAFEAGVAHDVAMQRGGAALRLGQVALWRGAGAGAVDLLRQSVAALLLADAGFLEWAAYSLQLACALVGDLDGATDAARVAAEAPHYQLFRSERYRADAATAAARGELSAARALAAEGAGWSRARPTHPGDPAGVGRRPLR